MSITNTITKSHFDMLCQLCINTGFSAPQVTDMVPFYFVSLEISPTCKSVGTGITPDLAREHACMKLISSITQTCLAKESGL